VIPDPTYQRTTTVKYSGLNIIVHVLAYRDLTDNEVLDCFSEFLRANRRKKLKDGMEVEISSPIGLSDPL
jgi:hypothetical protein